MKEARRRRTIVASSARMSWGTLRSPRPPSHSFGVLARCARSAPEPPRSMRGGLEQADAFGGGGECGGWGAGGEDAGGGDLGAGALESLDEVDVRAAFGT